MKMSDMRAKARAIFGPAIAEPMPKQPNGAKALQERANARPIPTYKVGGAVKKNMPPQPTAAEREADRKRREEYAKMKPTKEQGEAIARGNRAAAIEGGRYKNGGKAKKDGLAVMIAIGSPKKPVKKMGGGMACAEGGKPMKKAVGGAAIKTPAPKVVAPSSPPRTTAPSSPPRTTAPSSPPRTTAPSSPPRTTPSGPPAPGPVHSEHKIPLKMQLAPKEPTAPTMATKAPAASSPRTPPAPSGPPAPGPVHSEHKIPLKKQLAPKVPTPIKRAAAGGAAKVRKGMMTPEGVITHAMNKLRGK